MAIIFLGENNPSQVYVNSKVKYAAEIGIECRVFGQNEANFGKMEVLSLISQLNEDEACVGIIVQLPLPEFLKGETDSICAAVRPMKDIDGLGGVLCKWNQL